MTFNWVTADGYFAGADGDLDWVVPDEQQAKAAADSISGFDTAMFGRRTYELFERFWRSRTSTRVAPFPIPITRDDDPWNTAQSRSRSTG
ncbi:MAG TPA: hypothetical protein VHZ49_11795 [Methylomirabilota bacterium]|nr:hypothetical protein [Methylomirabilota bacterium]